jgi:hypothetical protein
MPEFDKPILDFMYWYTKLFTFSINRRKFELESTESRLCAVNSSRNTIWAVLFCGFGSLFFFSGLTALSQSNEAVTTGFVIVFFVIHPLFALICLRQFLWLVNGKQELLIENGNLTLRKKGTFFTKNKVYPVKLISNIRKSVDESKLLPVQLIVARLSGFRKVFLTQVFGEILFDFNTAQ